MTQPGDSLNKCVDNNSSEAFANINTAKWEIDYRALFTSERFLLIVDKPILF